MKSELAIFTISRNESFFLPLWKRYYGEFVPPTDLFVLDHQSTDGSTTEPGHVRIPIENPTSDDVHWMRHKVEEFVRDLFYKYRRVIFTEVDEFLVPNPAKYEDLWVYLQKHPQSLLTATGFDVCQTRDSAPVDPERPLQGKWWKKNDRYDKTLIMGEPLKWEVGFHRPHTDYPRPGPDHDLLLIHLHYLDREIAWNRIQSRMAGMNVIQDGLGWQNKIQTRSAFDQHFDDVTGGCSPISELYWDTL